MPRKSKKVVEEVDEYGVFPEDDPGRKFDKEDVISNGEDVQFEEGNYPTLERVPLGLFSLDLALSSKGDLGLPMRVLTEMYGYTNVGKSTLAYYMLGKVAQHSNTAISIADLEMLDLSLI